MSLLVPIFFVILAWFQPAFAKPKFYFYIEVTCPTCKPSGVISTLNNKADPFDTIAMCKKALRVAKQSAQRNGLKTVSASCLMR